MFRFIEDAEWVHGGVTYYITPPETAREVLYADLWLSSHIVESESSRHIALMAKWCAGYVRSMSAEDIDALGPLAMDALRQAIIESASLPPRVLEAVYTFYRVLYSGGCECMICKDSDRIKRLDDKGLERVRLSCRLKDVRPFDMRVADMAHGAEGTDPLDMPWWLYQLQNHRQAGINRGRADKYEEAEASKAAQAVLEEKGIWRKRR